MRGSQPLDFPRWAGYVIGAGFCVWLGGGGFLPLVAGCAGLYVLRKVLSTFE